MTLKITCIEKLRLERPDVAILMTLDPDPYFIWDGDGPSPEKEGFIAFNMRVKAVTIRKGTLLDGYSILGGCYFKLDEPIGDVHGYLPQMVEEALAELDQKLTQLGIVP